MEHRTTIIELGEGTTQVVCSCGWRSERYGRDKDIGTMDRAAAEATASVSASAPMT